MKKILFTATVDSHINHFHLPYLKLFKDKGYEVHVATNTDEPIKYCDVKHKINFERSPFKINNLKAIKQLKKVLDEEKFDVIHCHTPMGSVITRIAAISTRKVNNTRLIYTAHGFHFYKGAPIINWLLFYPIEKWLSKYTDTLITINNEDYELAKRKFKSKNIELVNGVGIEQKKFNFKLSEKEKNNLRESIGLTPDDFVIIYVAELNKRKNQKMALKAIESLSKKHSNIKLMLIGKDSLNFYYQKLAKKLKIENNIKFLGYRSDIPKLIKISNLAISTAKQEGLPVNIMEYMLCNLPIIATNCRGNRDLVKNSKNSFLVEINDYLLMAEKIEEKYIEKSIDTKMLQYSKEDANKYLLDNIIKKMKEIYNV
ncbi:MAG: glycosyltransferase family 4 protein [Clostridia bacterium]